MRKPRSPGVAVWIAAASLFSAAAAFIPAGCGQPAEKAPAVSDSAEQPGTPPTGGEAPPFSMPGAVALVNGEEVTEEDYLAALRSGSLLAKQATLEGRMEVLQDVIDQVLVRQQAEKEGYGERADVRRILERRKRRIIQQQTVRRLARELEVPTDQQVDEALGPLGELLDISVLLLDTEEDGDEAIARIRAGEEWGVVYREMSISPGAALGEFVRRKVERGRTMYPEDVEDAIFSLEVGEISPPLETPVGYLVVRLDVRRERPPEEVKEMQFKTQTVLLREQLEEKGEAIVAEQLGKMEVKRLHGGFDEVPLPDREETPARIMEAMEALPLAEVGGTVITMADYFNSARDYLLFRDKKPESQGEAFEELLQRRIKEVAIYQYARERGWDESAEIEAEMALNRSQLMIAMYTYDMVNQAREAAGPVEREKVREFFDLRKDRYLNTERLAISQILVRRLEESDLVLDRLAGGTPFAALAREVSLDDSAPAGGDLGNRAARDFSGIFGEQGVEDILVRARAGQTAPLTVRTTSGFHTILIREYQKTGEGRFEDLYDLVLPDYTSFQTHTVLQERRRQILENSDIRIDEEKVASIELPEGPAPGFHGGDAPGAGGGGVSPHGGGGAPAGGFPAGHP